MEAVQIPIGRFLQSQQVLHSKCGYQCGTLVCVDEGDRRAFWRRRWNILQVSALPLHCESIFDGVFVQVSWNLFNRPCSGINSSYFYDSFVVLPQLIFNATLQPLDETESSDGILASQDQLVPTARESSDDFQLMDLITAEVCLNHLRSLWSQFNELFYPNHSCIF